mmetsp:Transcript_133871/g.427874  ORF Transcript_133871/g.427874 Transcript_133871/m.427874 type:complete len:240 (-) Transcript_133871:75-794(-)
MRVVPAPCLRVVPDTAIGLPVPVAIVVGEDTSARLVLGLVRIAHPQPARRRVVTLLGSFVPRATISGPIGVAIIVNPLAAARLVHGRVAKFGLRAALERVGAACTRPIPEAAIWLTIAVAVIFQRATPAAVVKNEISDLSHLHAMLLVSTAAPFDVPQPALRHAIPVAIVVGRVRISQLGGPDDALNESGLGRLRGCCRTLRARALTFRLAGTSLRLRQDAGQGKAAQEHSRKNHPQRE